MKVSMNVLFDSHAELAQFTAALSKLYIAPTAEAPHNHSGEAALAKAVESKSVKPVADKATKAAPKEEPKEDTEDAAEAPDETEKKGDVLEANYKNMKEAVLLLNRVKGRAAIDALLRKYDGEKNGKLVVGPHIPEKHFAAIIADVNKQLA